MDRHRGLVRTGALAAALTLALASGTIRAAAMDSGAGGKPAPSAPAPAPPVPSGKVILQWDHLDDSNDRTFEDYWGFLSYKQTHYQAWYGEFTKGAEIGGYLRDHRRSTYSAFYRYRKDFDHVLEVDTEQVLKKGFVLAALLRGIHTIPEDAPDGRDLLQAGTGFDYYWGDYNFLSFRAIDDPRAARRWSFIASHRFQRDPARYVQPGIIKKTDGTTGWFLQGKLDWFRWGVGRYNQFDFTDIDRTIYSVGVELSY